MIKIIQLTDSIKRIEFKDKLGNRCYLQQSLNIINPSVHFGVQNEEGEQNVAVISNSILSELLPFLLQLVKEGKLIKDIDDYK